MKCFLYKSLLHENEVLIILKKDFFYNVPRKVILQLGTLEFVKEISLKEKEFKSLDTVEIIQNNLLEKGYHRQRVFLV